MLSLYHHYMTILREKGQAEAMQYLEGLAAEARDELQKEAKRDAQLFNLVVFPEVLMHPQRMRNWRWN